MNLFLVELDEIIPISEHVDIVFPKELNQNYKDANKANLVILFRNISILFLSSMIHSDETLNVDILVLTSEVWRKLKSKISSLYDIARILNIQTQYLIVLLSDKEAIWTKKFASDNVLFGEKGLKIGFSRHLDQVFVILKD